MKIFNRDEIISIIHDLRKKSSIKVGFTSGSFDLVHLGHIDYLKKSKKHCDVLIVGVNSDESVRNYKDKRRPIQSERDRLRFISSLDMIDYCFLFDEINNNINVQKIKPDLYIKAKDYNQKKLTSSKYLSQWGGKVQLIDFLEGFSTSRLIEKILDKYGYPQEIPLPYRERKKTIFLDRDGVINEDIGYLSDFKNFKFLDGVIEGLKLFRDAGFRLVIITNQAGIGMGYYSREDFYEVNRRMLEVLYKNGIILDKIYYCPHSLEDGCNCRKPKTGLFERAVEECFIDTKGSYMVGDKMTDMEAGNKVGLICILLDTKGKYEKRDEIDYKVNFFKEVVQCVLNR